MFIFYNVDPFYQNYPEYLQSGTHSRGAWSQLTGSYLSDSEQTRVCGAKSCRVDGQGRKIFPCGLQATSLFNDTFEFTDTAGKVIPMDTSGVAWSSDMERFRNPAQGYPGDPAFSWLFQRYPTVVSEQDGVRDPRFVAWMKPEALPSMLKLYGMMTADVAGKNLTLQINSSFPVTHLGARKQLLITTATALGGRSDSFAAFLVFSGCGCLAMALLVLAVHVCCARQPGRSRCGDDSDEEAGELGSETEDSDSDSSA